MAERAQGLAVTGLFVVNAVLAVTLALTGYFSDRAAQEAARDVLFRRAADAASAFHHALQIRERDRSTPLDPGELRRLAERTAADRAVTDRAGEGRVGIALVKPNFGARRPPDGALWETGEVVASSGGLRPGQTVSLRGVGLGAQRHSIEGRGPDRALVYWRAIHLRSAPWSARGVPVDRLRRLRFVRVTVPWSLAAPVLAPARITWIAALATSPLLLAAGVVFLRAARRAQRAEREAERRRALSAIGEMSAVLAHEIRTPLASIKGNVQLLGEEGGADARVRSIVAQTARLERLVNGLLDFARPKELALVPCDAGALAHEAAEVVRPMAHSAGVNLVIDSAGPASFAADRDQLLRVLVNLLRNGIEANVEAGRSSEAVVMRVRAGRGRVSFVVLDRGAGLGSRSADDLFKPFISTKEGGSGLGLAIARQIVETHGGTLTLEDRPDGPGARATVVLPVREVPR